MAKLAALASMAVVSIVLCFLLLSIARHPLLATSGLLVQPVTQRARHKRTMLMLGRCEPAGWHGVKQYVVQSRKTNKGTGLGLRDGEQERKRVVIALRRQIVQIRTDSRQTTTDRQETRDILRATSVPLSPRTSAHR